MGIVDADLILLLTSFCASGTEVKLKSQISNLPVAPKLKIPAA